MAHGTRDNDRGRDRKKEPLMAWDFSTDPDFEQQLEWMRGFVAEEIEPLDLVFRDPAAHVDPRSPAARAMAPLKKEVKNAASGHAISVPSLAATASASSNWG